MRITPLAGCVAVVGVLSLAFCARAATPAPGAMPAPEATPEGIEFFEKHVRPVLVEACYRCHSAEADKVKGKLYVDSAEGMARGGESGALIVPGKPAESLLIKAVRWEDDSLRMPPKKRLTDGQVKALEAWVAMGAPYPRSAAARPTVDAMEEARRFWSFVPPKAQPLPAVKDAAWARNEIDRFVLARLEAGGLAPSREADRRTLVRRATFDLHGLPPTMEEVEAFVNDPSPDAWEKVIDRLLASPRYGERWGRHWLDVARYADTKGYVFQEERRYPFAYTYRDWVIDALNRDLPYDRFLVYQIAADKADLGEDKRPLAAMGFLTLGRRFLNNQADIIDDRIDVLTRGTLGLTVTCARCHDHKFDPVSMKDYYGLYGVFASSTEPAQGPVIGDPSKREAQAAFEKELAAKQGDVQAFLEKRHKAILAQARSPEQIAAYLVAAQELLAARGDEARGIAQKHNLRRGLLTRWRDQLRTRAKDPVFLAWAALARLEEKDFAAKAADAVEKAKGNPLVAGALLTPAPPKTLREAAARYGAVLARHDAEEAHDDAAAEEVRRALRGEGAALDLRVADAEQLFDRDDRNKVQELRQKVDRLVATHPGAPARAMVLNDLPRPVEPRIFVRGNPGNPGQQVPRQFLEALSPRDRKPFREGSGRLELARAIASPDNPLTPRVMVNRVWAWHFGAGLVRTPSDFGTRGEPPTHPELLDDLAVKFVRDDGWSLKKLHRRIMLSATYRQASDERPEAMAVDPENRLLWKFNRQRLGFEAMRDSLLAAAGHLDPSAGGPAVDITARPFSRRRTVYGFIDRQNLPGVFRAFDFAGPDTHAPQRFQTTVPQQALFLMNSPFAIEQARALAKRVEGVEGEGGPEKRVEAMYRIAFQRLPAPDEVELAVAFISAGSAPGDGMTPWERYAQALLLSNEFAFVD